MQIYLVGGAVRDEILGLPVKEKDYVVVGATEKDMLAQGFQKVGKDFPVFLHPETKEEYALARTERKTGRGYDGFTCDTSIGITLEQDLLRRDLTINAIARTEEGRYIDPYGGMDDLSNRVLRHVSGAFVEDPLRLLRVARFAAKLHHLGFGVAQETHCLMYQMVQAGEIKALVPERVWQETLKALNTPSPEVFFNILRQTGALPVLFPELHALFGVPAKPSSHPKIDCGIHNMMVLAAVCQLSGDPMIRFATLLHDLVKAQTPYSSWPSHPEHEEKGVALVDKLCGRLKVPNAYRTLARLAARYHGWIHSALTHDAESVVRFFCDIDALRHPERLAQLITVAKADYLGRKGIASDAVYPQGDFLQQAFELVLSVTAAPFVKQNFKGLEIQQAMRCQQITLIDILIKERYESPNEFGVAGS